MCECPLSQNVHVYLSNSLPIQSVHVWVIDSYLFQGCYLIKKCHVLSVGSSVTLETVSYRKGMPASMPNI